MNFHKILILLVITANLSYSQYYRIDSTDFIRNVWENIGPAGKDFSDFTFLDNNHNSIVVATQTNGVFKITNSGEDWNDITNELQGKYINLVAAKPKNPNVIFAGTLNNGLYITQNGGASWKKLSVMFDEMILFVEFSKFDGDTIYVGTDSLGLFRSINGGDSWNSIPLIDSMSGCNSIQIDPTDNKKIYISTISYSSNNEKNILKSTDFGLSWESIYSNPYLISSIHINPINKHFYAIVYYNNSWNLIKSINNGIEWESKFQVRDSFFGLGLKFINNLIFDPDDSNTVYLSTYNNFGDDNFTEFIKSSDGGNSWKYFTRFSLERAVKTLFSPTDFNVFYALDFDSGLNKISKDLFPSDRNDHVSYYPLNIGNSWTYFYRNCELNCDTSYFTETVSGKIIKPNGKEYYKIESSRSPGYTYFVRIDSLNLYVIQFDVFGFDGEFILYDLYSPSNDPYSILSTYERMEWNIIKTGNMYLDELSYEANFKAYTFIGLMGLTTTLVQNIGITRRSGGEGNYFERVLIKAQIDDVEYDFITDIENKESVSNKYHLSQNYPNPFNPSTTISYSIPNVASGFSQGNVKLTVYNILGQKIATLVNQHQKPGNYKTVFDASNLPSGIYYYSLSVNNYLSTKKMVFLK